MEKHVFLILRIGEKGPKCLSGNFTIIRTVIYFAYSAGRKILGRGTTITAIKILGTFLLFRVPEKPVGKRPSVLALD